MKRSELLRRIRALPADADVGVQIGDVVAWGDGAFGALQCHRADLRDLFLAWKPAPTGQPIYHTVHKGYIDDE
jgi:hypothetical protein